MEHALIICRSQTEAIGLCHHLQWAGIYGEVVRIPRVAAGSCAFAVRIEVWEQDLARDTIYQKRLGNYSFRLEESS